MSARAKELVGPSFCVAWVVCVGSTPTFVGAGPGALKDRIEVADACGMTTYCDRRPQTSRVILRNGTLTLMRRVQPADFNGLLRFFDGLSLRSRYLRFCSGGANLTAVARIAAEASDRRVGFVACDVQGDIVAHAEYAVTAPDEAEVGVVVADRLQGLGLARGLIGELAADAGARGVRRFRASVLPENTPMLALFMRGFGATVRDLSAECAVSFAVDRPTVARVAA